MKTKLTELLKEKLKDFGYYDTDDFDERDSIFLNALVEVAENIADDGEWYTKTEYTGWPDGRGGDVLALYFKHDGRYYRALIYDENTIKLDEIDQETYNKFKP